MNTGRNSKQTTCLCRDTGGKGTLPAQHTTFNALDNWAINPIKKEKDQKEKVIGSWPGTCMQYTRLHLDHWVAAWMVTWLTNWVGCLRGGLCKLDCLVPLWIRGFNMCMIVEQDQVIIFCT